MNLPTHPVQLEFEKYFSALGVGCVSSRNAGLISWKEGVHLDKKEFTMTGFVAKRVAETKLAKEVQTKVLKMWVGESTQNEITEYSKEQFNEVKQGRKPIEYLVKRQRLKSNRLKVKCPDCKKRYDVLTAPNNCECGTSKSFFTTLEGKNPTFGSGIAGVIWFNTTQDKKINDSFYFLKVEPSHHTWTHPLKGQTKKVEWISAPNLELLNELVKDFKIDFKHYSNVVVDKVKPIYDAMSWNTEAVSLDERQKTLTEWF